MSSAEPMTIVGMPRLSTARAMIEAVWWHKGHMGTTRTASKACRGDVIMCGK